MGAAWLNARNCAVVGPPETNARPSRPSEAQLTADCGPPDRVGLVGCVTRGLIRSLTDSELDSTTDIAGS